MKRLTRNLTWMLTLLFAATLTVGCAKSASDDEDTAEADSKLSVSEERVYELADKYMDSSLTEEEFAEVLDIWEEFQDNLFKKAESLAKNCKTQREFGRKMAKYEAKYSYMRELNFIFSVPEYMMGSENYKKLQSMQEKYSKKDEEISSLLEGKPGGKVGRGYDSADSAYTSPAEAPAVEYVEPADSAAEEAPRSRVQLL